MNRYQALFNWIAATRHDAPTLDDDADALQLRLLALAAHEQAIQTCRGERSSIALFGHSQASKRWLLTALSGRDDGQFPVIAGMKRIHYFHPATTDRPPCQMAMRFTCDTPAPDAAFPLRLQLLSEAQLAQVFIHHAWHQGDARPLDINTFTARLAALQPLRQPRAMNDITREEIAVAVRFWQRLIPVAHQHIDDTLWYQFADLLPSLDLTGRARAWSLLWGDQPALTQQWNTLSYALHLLGHNNTVHAPLSLLVDSYLLPAEGFLLAEGENALPVLVQLPSQQTVSIATSLLAQLTLELTLTCEENLLGNVDLIDIPQPQTQPDAPLWMSKCQWLIEGYSQALRPDILLVCNATAQRHTIVHTASALTRWAETTQPDREGGLPGLVWAITPQNDRRVHHAQHDDAVQHLVGRPGERWGALHAFDNNSLQRLVEWLSQALLPAARQQRLDALARRHHQACSALFDRFLAPEQRLTGHTEAMIRELQAQAASHGELLAGLLPPLSRFAALTEAPQTREARVSGLFQNDIDLFAPADAVTHPQQGNQDAGTRAWKLWCQHLRHWSRQEVHASRSGLSTRAQQHLANTLMSIGDHCDLAGQLRTAATAHAGPAQLRAMISNFIDWLGYADMPESARPASRVDRQRAIFATPATPAHIRLTRLNDQPVHAASRYVYDWLVALYTRSRESDAREDAQALAPQARQVLQHLLSAM